MNATTNEQDVRLAMLTALSITPHRKLDSVYPVHAGLVEMDPLFYVHLAAWYRVKGEIRDHNEAFVVALAMSSFEGHRDVACALLREMAPYQVCRIVDFINGGKVKRKTAAAEGGQGKPAVTTITKVEPKIIQARPVQEHSGSR
jgi:hypothetical protein